MVDTDFEVKKSSVLIAVVDAILYIENMLLSINSENEDYHEVEQQIEGIDRWGKWQYNNWIKYKMM